MSMRSLLTRALAQLTEDRDAILLSECLLTAERTPDRSTLPDELCEEIARRDALIRDIEARLVGGRVAQHA